jgi:malonyl-CoA O-methyltransferase
MRGLFVTGTDTGVGKTVVSACLVRAWDADYWKPIQTGLAAERGDAATVAELAMRTHGRIHPNTYALQSPLSPHAAAALEGVAIDLKRIQLPHSARPIVVEGAGGLLVPIDEFRLMIDLIAQLGLPAVLVARASLGTINHTLLSLEALRARALPVLGVVMVGEPNAGNRDTIERLGRVSVIAELPLASPLDFAAIDRLSKRIPALERLAA